MQNTTTNTWIAVIEAGMEKISELFCSKKLTVYRCPIVQQKLSDLREK